MGKKRDREGDEDLNSSDSDASVDLANAKEQEDEIQVEMQFFDPVEGDFHAVRAFLSKYAGGLQYDVGDLVDLVISQRTVGTMVKVEDDIEPYGFITALNLEAHKVSAPPLF